MALMDEEKVRKRIKELIAASGLTQQAISAKIGMGSGHLSKILSGADGRKVRLDHVFKIADALDLPIWKFFPEPLRIPVVGGVTAHGGPSTLAVEKTEEAEEFVELFGKDETEGCYMVKITDGSMLPAFNDGTRLTAKQDTWELIKDYDYVIYRGSQHLQVRQILITPESIVLRGINPSIKELVLPRPHLKLCDRVITVYPA